MSATLDYCAPLGIPLSAFEGAPAPRPGIDPYWTTQDRELAVAWHQRKARACSGCGTLPELWKEDRNALTWKHRYCPGCETVKEGRDQVSEHATDFVYTGLVPWSEVEDDEERAQ